MESNDEQPELVDLLYDDELDEETADEVRGDLADDPSERAELEEYESMLSRIREHDTEEEVPGDVHDAIIDQARDAARDRSEQKAKPDRREPSARDGSGPGSLWQRIAGGANISQVAVAAAALLACGVVYYMSRATLVGDSSEQATATQTFESANEGVESSVKFGDEESEEATEETPDETPAADDSIIASEESAGAGELEAPTRSDDETKKRPAPSPADDSEASADLDQPPEPNSPKQIDDEQQQLAKKERSGTSRQQRGRAADDSGSKKTAGADLMEGSDDSDEASDDMAALEAFGSQSAGGSTGSSGSTSSSASDDDSSDDEARDNSAVADVIRGGDSDDDKVKAESDETKSKKEAPPKKQAEKTTIDEAEAAFNRGDWSETIAQADLILQDDVSDERETARALELKARAYEKQGELDRAYALFVQLASDFPSYKEAAVQKAQRRLKSERDGRTQRMAAESDQESPKEDEADQPTASEPAEESSEEKLNDADMEIEAY